MKEGEKERLEEQLKLAKEAQKAAENEIERMKEEFKNAAMLKEQEKSQQSQPDKKKKKEEFVPKPVQTETK